MSRLYSTEEAARLLRIHHMSVCRIIRSGRLPALKIGRTWVVNEEDLDELQKSYQGGKGRPPKRKTREQDNHANTVLRQS